MSVARKLRRKIQLTDEKIEKRKVRKELSADGMFDIVRQELKEIPDHRRDNVQISLEDALMAGFAVFQLKHPSLLAFEKERLEDQEGLKAAFHFTNVPCDTQMRTILDPVHPEFLRSSFSALFRALQRGKGLEDMTWLGDHYLLSGDGTGFYSSAKVSSPYCLRKKSDKNGNVLYQMQMYAGAIVCPGKRTVIPLFPEMIRRQDGNTKNDCERSAAARFYAGFRKDHPSLKTIVIEDALSSNGPHIEDLMRHDLRFILGAKEGDHRALFDEVDMASTRGEVMEFGGHQPDNLRVEEHYRFVNGVPLNKSHPDLLVNVLEFWETKDEKTTKFSWVTDIEITEENVREIMLAGRARWKIENETFNTLKNQGYNLGHNYGLGKIHLSAVLTTLMMLAFLVDQIQRKCCWLYREAMKRTGADYKLYELMRSIIDLFLVTCFEDVLRMIVETKKVKPGWEKRLP